MNSPTPNDAWSRCSRWPGKGRRIWFRTRGREPGWAVPQVSREPSAQETMIPGRQPPLLRGDSQTGNGSLKRPRARTDILSHPAGPRSSRRPAQSAGSMSRADRRLERVASPEARADEARASRRIRDIETYATRWIASAAYRSWRASDRSRGGVDDPRPSFTSSRTTYILAQKQWPGAVFDRRPGPG